MLPLVAAVALSYLLGSVPWGLVLVRLIKGIDLRTVGSGNIGATNAMRAGGKPLGLAVFALDFLKGWAAVELLAVRASGQSVHSWGAVLCGAAAVIGHCFPVWLRFKGGKGVATGCGALVAIDPGIWILGGAVWLIVLGATRMVSLASILMGLAFVAAALYRTRELQPTAGAALLAVLILARHRSNMARIVAGTEPRIFQPRGGDGARRG